MRYPVPALWRIRPVDVHDGDTIRAVVDRGIDETAEWAVRLDGVWAPELSQPGGPETRAYVTGWLAEHGDASEWPLLLQTLRTPRSDTEVMTLSRYVGVISAADGHVLNADVAAFVAASGYGGGIGA